MSLFQCDNCGVIENTACTNGYVGYSSSDPDSYWVKSRVEKGLKPKGKYCSQCFDGKWHDIFPRDIYPIGTKHTDRFGNISR